MAMLCERGGKDAAENRKVSQLVCQRDARAHVCVCLCVCARARRQLSLLIVLALDTASLCV
jgi:hypothetical protein